MEKTRAFAQGRKGTYGGYTIFIRRLDPGDGGTRPTGDISQSNVLPPETFFIGRFCQVDTKKARRWIAPVVKRGQIGRVVAREPITTKFFEVPEVRPIRETR